MHLSEQHLRRSAPNRLEIHDLRTHRARATPRSVGRWIQTLVLVAVAALLANSQCQALCLASAAQIAPQQDHASCHHSSQSKTNGGSHCNHRHSDSISTEASPDGGNLAAPVQLFVAAIGATPVQLKAGCSLLSASESSPPANPLFLSFSVLRL
jgi:hypothetical protein